MDELNRLRWLKSSYSNGGGGGQGGGNCVEAAGIGDHRAIRDSKHPDGPAFVLSATSWTNFLNALKRGDFDL
jgi:hypothetical protein